MLVVFSPISVADTKIIYGYDFVAPLMITVYDKNLYGVDICRILTLSMLILLNSQNKLNFLREPSFAT